MARAFFSAALACTLLLSTAAFASDNSKLPPMDAAAAAPAQDHLPDTVMPDGMHMGSWSASNPDAGKNAPPPAVKPAGAAPASTSASGTLPDTVLDNGMHVGSWSANGPVTAPAAAPQTAAQGGAMGNSTGDGGDAVPQSQTMTVTTLQTCYDQLTPAEVAEVKMNYLKPYAECQARLQAKLDSKNELKQGEVMKSMTPESPRNYVRVQAPDVPAPPPNSPAKSGTTLNP